MTIRRLAIPLLVVVALAGCANGASDDTAAVPATTTSSAAPTEESSTKPPPAGSKTISGTVTAGVEPGCLLLEDHLLIIKDTALKSVAKVGASVTATGEAQPGMMTTCQQGTPFVVATIRAN
ncbi:hypothetical protein Adi01nite_26830 [Amorphoplanes digitatis]|uniref:Glucose/arabinose dehydrogenase n=1 Tax=Actinoplanes digitatis TaxID=1868 RepID=A0A7W7MTW8_9ACTN|nr:hypothetical protein [Actinoplanes digitatis]MBB4765934.1 glucose/arabinose dehydrogenase [Actinoplanes digitatis]GID93271.1 hypothetical protein Adi01nite_26830 [Actinoplanes digitatis]